MSINNFIIDRSLINVKRDEVVDFKPIYVHYFPVDRVDIEWPSTAGSRDKAIMSWDESDRELKFNWYYAQGDRPSNLNPVINRTFSQLGFPGYVNIRQSSIVYWPTANKSNCIELGHWRSQLPNIINLDEMNKLAGVSKPRKQVIWPEQAGTGQGHISNMVDEEKLQELREKQRADYDMIRKLYDKFCSAMNRGEFPIAEGYRNEAMQIGLQSMFDMYKTPYMNDEINYKLLQFYKEPKPEGWNPILEKAIAAGKVRDL